MSLGKKPHLVRFFLFNESRTAILLDQGVFEVEKITADVLTLDEQGIKGFELYLWFGIVARTGTPDSIVAKLNQIITQVAETPEFKQRPKAPGADR
ncbi:hypothetical protein EGT29_11745 [Pigmentiphaga sp. H8]|uniref:tripartite tricarboxylate transporter substrate-binding protein n=1 Tax=Pigmentiphaga sp. H8 TaxID=2488560 RepID=UPI000F59186B|nr:tripartite tricarboxylate transporter substrate-binding protein [Pigmentiphaga sp. H8]AZG08473.1 hypothetical protein EGT29_11745 [Pigmentiphaga sp. H8]